MLLVRQREEASYLYSVWETELGFAAEQVTRCVKQHSKVTLTALNL